MKKLPKYSVIHEYAEASRKKSGGGHGPAGHEKKDGGASHEPAENGGAPKARGPGAAGGGPARRRFNMADSKGLTSQIAVGMTLCVLIGVAGGRALDARLNTSPILLIIGVLLGVFAAFKTLYDIVIKKWMD